MTRGARDRTLMAPFICRTKTKQVPKRLGYIRPVNVGQTDGRRETETSTGDSFVFGFNFFWPESAAAFPSTSHDSTSSRMAVHLAATRDKRSASIGSRFRAGHFSLFEVCQVFLATRFCTRTSSNRRFDATPTRAPRCRSRSPSSRFPGSSSCRSGPSARLSHRPPPRPLRLLPLSHVARERMEISPYPSPNAALATRGKPRPPRPPGTRSAPRAAGSSLSRSL